ncbi:hypothetical protein [Candidatus Pyrohabitans sp.]
MGTPLRNSTLREIRKMKVEEQIKLMEELILMLKKGVKRRSVRELKGLGREVWRGVNVEEYIEGERSSWNY